jgi:hypothetical protein
MRATIGKPVLSRGEKQMGKVLKWIAIVIGSLLGLIILFVAGLAIYANLQFKPSYADRPLYPITADSSPAGVERGKYLMEDGCWH